MNGANLLIPATISGGLMAGMILALPRAIQAPFARRLGKEETATGALQLLLNLLLIPLLLAAGFSLDHWGVQEVIITGSLLVALGTTFLAGSRSIAQAGMALVPAGAGAACLITGSCVLMPRAFPKDLLAATYSGTVFLILGVLLMPVFADRLVRRFGLRHSLLVIALAALLPGLLAAFLPNRIQPETPHQDRALDSPALWLTGLVLLCYVPLVILLASRTQRYLVQVGHRPGLASVLAGCFWLSFLTSRVGGAVLFAHVDLIPKDPEPWIILLLAVALGIGLGNMAGSDNPRGAGVGLLLAGVCLGPILPTALGLVFRLFPDEKGMACGVVGALGTLGGLAATWTGSGSREAGPEKNLLRGPLVLTLFLAVAALVLVLAIPLHR
jgi:MFS family permease